eukprot:TRINITY_DN3845_c0_g1_i1.p1 TRINITY_DN3845_c0_g1~~TRINITY_DN3845_c0_g1_i1.p1  ORF type:complete len:569 (-),score=137.79 TRINITY_DN3845_c0_g1_i1:75-1781(-)
MQHTIPKVTPWSSFDEWKSVFRDLFHEDSSNRQNGIETIEMWRCRGRVPHAVNVSAQIIEAQSNDASGFFSEYQMRLSYSMILVRMVNGIVDSQQKGERAQSILKLAESIDFPSWLVDQRHAATHNELPSISILREAMSTGLKWFYDRYWMCQYECLDKVNSTLQQQIIDLHSAVLKDSDETVLLKLTQSLIAITTPVAVKSELISLLVGRGDETGILIPTDRKIFSPNQMGFCELVERWTPCLIAFQDMWPHFTGSLILALCDRLSAISELYPEKPASLQPVSKINVFHVGQWIRFLLSRHWWSNSVYRSEDYLHRTELTKMSPTERSTALERAPLDWICGPEAKAATVSVSLEDIVTCLSRRPTPNCMAIVLKLTKNLDELKAFCRSWRYLYCISGSIGITQITQSEIRQLSKNNDAIPELTLEGVEAHIKREKTSLEEKESKWSFDNETKVLDVEFPSEVPVGLVPGVTFSNESLLLPASVEENRISPIVTENSHTPVSRGIHEDMEAVTEYNYEEETNMETSNAEDSIAPPLKRQRRNSFTAPPEDANTSTFSVSGLKSRLKFF